MPEFKKVKKMSHKRKGKRRVWKMRRVRVRGAAAAAGSGKGAKS